jgi:maltose O-acetyltransferase
VLFGPAVQVYAATHPLRACDRMTGRELGRDIQIDDDVWIGGAAIICPGVRIGARSVIEAGSVVTKDIPEGVFAARNPCRILREIQE